MSNVIIFIIKSYQMLISPFLSPCCKFIPSCSEFAIHSIKKHGFFVGIYLSLSRVFRCNPLNKKQGFDPVP